MSYRYDASKAERKAADLLLAKGWSVSEPPCPKCHGTGYIYDWSTKSSQYLDNSIATWVTSSTSPCPNGCPYAIQIYNAGRAKANRV